MADLAFRVPGPLAHRGCIYNYHLGFYPFYDNGDVDKLTTLLNEGVDAMDTYTNLMETYNP